MDCEKKYKEALERARMYRDNAKAVEDYTAVARYENIFPELKPDDETTRNEILAYIGSKLDINLETHNRWCSYLEKQKEQKPAWSEEDEKMRNLAIEWAETMYGQFRFVDMGSTDFRKIVDWLRDLRPSWKPSEEQMNCLCAAVDEAIRKHNESVSGYKPAIVLKSLYEQLKKL